VGKVDEVSDVGGENLNPETPECISKLSKTPHHNSATFQLVSKDDNSINHH
jgi:hypothetical protein